MVVSTERTVRDVLVAAIQAKAVSDLGFDAEEGNVKDYILEYAHPERAAEYLNAKVDGKQIVWAIAVQVTGADSPYGMKNLWKREYSIEIVFYRDIGRDGSGVNQVIDAANTVRGIMRDLTNGLSGTVNTLSSGSELDSRIVDGPDSRPGKMIEARLRYKAERVQPDFYV